MIAGHSSAEYSSGGIGNHVIEPRVSFGGDRPDNLREFPVSPKRDVSAIPEQEQTTVRFEGKAADWPSLVDLFMMPAIRVIAEQAAIRNIGPVEAFLQRMPKRIFACLTCVVGNEFRFRGTFGKRGHSGMLLTYHLAWDTRLVRILVPRVTIF